MSAEISGETVGIQAVTAGNEAPESGVAHGDLLVAFTEAAVGPDDAALEEARARLLEAMGPEALVDSAGVVGNFERMVRIADSTGIPLDKTTVLLSRDLRRELGVERFGSAANTPEAGPLRRLLSRALQPAVGPLVRIAMSLRR